MNAWGNKQAHLARGSQVVERSRIAHLNWFADLYPRLVRLSEPFTQGSERFPHLFFTPSEPTRSYHFQLNAVSTKILRPLVVDDSEHKVSHIREEDATLVYSMHQSGAVSVTISPHSSEWSKWEKKYYVVDFIRSPSDLAGPVGDKRIRKHIALFLEVAHRSMAVNGISDDGFIERLGKSSDRYESVFATRVEARRAWADAQIALGAGLLGGLIASTIIPFAQSYGSEKRALATAVETACKTFASYASERACNLAHPTYVVDHWIGEVLSTGNLLVIALAISLVTVVIMTRILRQR